LIELCIYFFPLATKQCSISFAHTREDIQATLEQVKCALELISR
jgi:glutamate-1-semialdehyde aminotransferase